MKVKDTDIGKSIQTQINDLKKLLKAYRIGLIKSNQFPYFPFFEPQVFTKNTLRLFLLYYLEIKITDDFGKTQQ